MFIRETTDENKEHELFTWTADVHVTCHAGRMKNRTDPELKRLTRGLTDTQIALMASILEGLAAKLWKSVYQKDRRKYYRN